MPLTPRLKWALPTAGTDPWEEPVRSLFEAIDATSYSYREDRNVVIMGGGTFTFTASTNTLSWDATIEIFSPITGFLTSIAAGSINILDREVLYVSLVRGITTPVAASVLKGSTVPSDDNSFLLAIRRQDRLIFRYNKILLDGSPSQVFQLNLGGGGGGFTIAGDGLFASGVTINVGDGAGLNTQADYIEIDLAASAGLEFDAPGVAGKLRVKADPAGALQLSGSGVSVKVNNVAPGNPTVATDANGLRVLGLPLSFNINSVAVGTSVTAANVTQITDGSYTTLHRHRDPLVANMFNRVGGANISVGDPISLSNDNSRVQKGQANTTTKATIIGVAITSALSGDPFDFISQGLATGVLSGATAQAPYYLASAGGLTATIPATPGDRIILVGWAFNTTDLWVQIQDLGTVP